MCLARRYMCLMFARPLCCDWDPHGGSGEAHPRCIACLTVWEHFVLQGFLLEMQTLDCPHFYSDEILVFGA